MSDYRFSVRVYYEDTDAAGLVYHANYLKFAERARSEMLRYLGIEHESLRKATGLFFVVHRCSADFIQAARLDDDLTVVTRIASIGAASIDFDQVVERAGVMLVRLTFQIACVGPTGRPQRIPAKFRTLLHLPKLPVEDIVNSDIR